jgi:hypothetical protein
MRFSPTESDHLADIFQQAKFFALPGYFPAPPEVPHLLVPSSVARRKRAHQPYPRVHVVPYAVTLERTGIFLAVYVHLDVYKHNCRLCPWAQDLCANILLSSELAPRIVTMSV